MEAGEFDYTSALATNVLSVQDDIEAASEMILAWHEKHDLEPEEGDVLISLRLQKKPQGRGEKHFTG